NHSRIPAGNVPAGHPEYPQGIRTVDSWARESRLRLLDCKAFERRTNTLRSCSLSGRCRHSKRPCRAPRNTGLLRYAPRPALVDSAHISAPRDFLASLKWPPTHRESRTASESKRSSQSAASLPRDVPPEPRSSGWARDSNLSVSQTFRQAHHYKRWARMQRSMAYTRQVATGDDLHPAPNFT